MDRVGGYDALKLLEQDAHAYEDVLIVMQGEAEARKIAEMEAKRG